MLDQLIIGNLASCDDFDASVKERTNTPGKKKSIKETVPFSNITYDFSKINGELYWEERTLKYVFEITASTPEELEEKKSAFAAWVMNVMNEEIYDPFIENYHFIGTFDDIEYSDDDIKSTITVTFTAYPYMISNTKKEYAFSLVNGAVTTARITNNSSHRITPTFVNDFPVTIQKGNVEFTIDSGETTDDTFQFEPGVTEVLITAIGTGNLKIVFSEEVF